MELINSLVEVASIQIWMLRPSLICSVYWFLQNLPWKVFPDYMNSCRNYLYCRYEFTQPGNNSVDRLCSNMPSWGSNVLLDCKKGRTTSESARFDIYGGFVYSFFLRRNFSPRCSIKAQVAIWRRRAQKNQNMYKNADAAQKGEREGRGWRNETCNNATGKRWIRGLLI